jgi:hypothetical protein
MKLIVALVSALALAVTSASSASAATDAGTPVDLSATQVAQVLFAAGDVGRLSQVPSGTESLVEEKVLQQLYITDPTLSRSQAVSDIQSLEATLAGSSPAISPATLTVMSGNERILAILNALTASGPPTDVADAIGQVDNQALTEASDSGYAEAQWFAASADSLDTISFEGFSPASVLAASASLAQANQLFGQARDALWQQDSHESVFDDARTLLNGNPSLQNSAVQQLVGMLGADGSLQTTVGQLEGLVEGGVTTIDDQDCALPLGSTGGAPSACTSGALHDAQMVANACQPGPSSACTAAKNQAENDATSELGTITAQQAATAAEANALDQANEALGQSELAESQAAAQVAEQEQEYLAYQSFQQVFKAGSDVAVLAVTLSVSEIDPVAAVTGLLNVIGDALGFGFSGPDPNTIILQGIQNLSQQLYDFETYTQTAFSAVSMQLAGISSQIAADASKLTTQLNEVQGTLNVLSGDLATLQTSVDHLQDEIQSLFASANWDSLRSEIDQYVGYQQQNGVPLGQSQFATAAGQLLSDAENTAVSETEVSPPGPFDSLDANSLVTSNDPDSLDTNINYFNLFGAGVGDSPSSVTWPGALTTTCAPGADVAAGICLPDPDYWATAARAFGQLLMENPSYVTRDRLAELQTIDQEGQVIASALAQLSSDDAGADPSGVNNAGTVIAGTGNKVLDAALGYYAYWGGARKHQTTIAPPLPIAVENEEATIESTTDTPGVFTGSNYGSAPIPYTGVYPWLGADQPPDFGDIAKINSLQTVPVCTTEGLLGNNFNYGSEDLLPAGAAITGQELAFMVPDVLNAVRVGQGTLTACYTAAFGPGTTATGGPFNMSLFFFYTGGSFSDQPVGEIDASGTANYCQPDLGNQNIDGVTAVGGGCNNADIVSLLEGAVDSGSTQQPTPPGLVTYADGQFDQALAGLQQTIYRGMINGTHLTQGTNPDYDDVEAAADRAAGGNALLNGYISLGLPQALASDDALNALVNGEGSDPFASPDANGCNVPGVVAGGTVEAELVNYLQAAAAEVGASGPAVRDPEQCISLLVQDRVAALAAVITPHIVPSTTGNVRAARTAAALAAQADPPGTATTQFAEDNPLIGPTLDRLDDTQAALAEEMADGTRLTVEVDGTGQGTVSGAGISCPGTCSAGETPQSSATLTATPAAGSTFTGWSGACTGTGTCTVTLPYDQNVIATFTISGAPVAPTMPAATTTTTTTTTPAATTTTSTVMKTPAAACSLVSSGGGSVLLQAPPAKKGKKGKAPKPALDTLSFTVRCNQVVEATLAGKLKRVIAAKTKHAKQRSKTATLGPVQVAVKANQAQSVAIKLPAAVVTGLTQGEKESATFTLIARNANGTTTTTAIIGRVTERK